MSVLGGKRVEPLKMWRVWPETAKLAGVEPPPLHVQVGEWMARIEEAG